MLKGHLVDGWVIKCPKNELVLNWGLSAIQNNFCIFENMLWSNGAYYALGFDTVDLSFNSFEGSSNFSTSARWF